ncbi:SRPBCC domain-containing protein [Algoriphagus sp. AGSA1]|uniref:SRPBCC family protein n=1 Tax=Algoriphagus sp. AGSA1 TaxID=2907213 RepID=UPI001F44A461|nr:SRPBCC domain-containing protein [Algoriphagus sp. AGSA1]MCE7053879.1 SRPBCC domain-containing protein [Algoriphagus sp. AGSA1]
MQRKTSIKFIELIMIGIVPVILLMAMETQAADLKNQKEIEELTKQEQNENMKEQAESDFSTTFLVNQSPKEVFNAVKNVRGWWSENIEGGTDKLNDEFIYHYKDVHYSKIRLVEVVPDQRLVWHVVENYFSFTKDKREWTDTKIIFEISKEGSQTKLHFTHQGLVPAYECFEVCSEGWTNYIDGSLKNLITKGKGEPNPKEGGFNQELVEMWKLEPISESSDQHFTVSFLVEQSPEEVFDAVTNIGGWLTENFTGGTRKLNDEFEVQFWDVHYSKQKLVEVIPNKRVVWQVTDSKLTFIEQQDEWTNTRVIFDISRVGNQTKVQFAHEGLTPDIACYTDCSSAWNGYLTGSLRDFITTGKGKPEVREDVVNK